MIYFTSICANYLPKAMVLAESVKRHCPGAIFVLCLVEREIPEVARTFGAFDEVVLAKDAGWQNFDSFIFRHSIVEASTAVKPRFMIHLMERYANHDKFVYLDPDVVVYSDLTELRALLDEASIVLCPHLLRPGNIDMEISSLAHGSYNLGFLAVRRSNNSSAFLEWWSERLFLFCYDDKERGIFTDQKWIDLAPCFFECTILKHHGYDFATWSLLGSDLREENGKLVVNGQPLRFIHFSGLDSGTIDKAIGWWLTEDNKRTFVELLAAYRKDLDEAGQERIGKLAWSYGFYDHGGKVSLEARVAYRSPTLWETCPSPFAESDDVILGSVEEPTDAVGDSGTLGSIGERTPASATILERFLQSNREVGLRRTMAKVFRRVVGGAKRGGG